MFFISDRIVFARILLNHVSHFCKLALEKLAFKIKYDYFLDTRIFDTFLFSLHNTR